MKSMKSESIKSKKEHYKRYRHGEQYGYAKLMAIYGLKKPEKITD